MFIFKCYENNPVPDCDLVLKISLRFWSFLCKVKVLSIGNLQVQTSHQKYCKRIQKMDKLSVFGIIST